MQGGSINRELYDYDKNIDVTSSAFIQQRDKIKPEMFRYIFQEYNKVCNDTKTHKGYKILGAHLTGEISRIITPYYPDALTEGNVFDY